MAWRRYCICELLQAENPSLRVESFRQEYPNTEDEAWAKVQGRRVFNPVQVRSRRAAMSKDPIAVGQLEWMVEPLRDANGNCTNKRALYVGFVPEIKDPFASGTATEKPIRYLGRVPGSPEHAATKYDVRRHSPLWRRIVTMPKSVLLGG